MFMSLLANYKAMIGSYDICWCYCIDFSVQKMNMVRSFFGCNIL